MLNMYICICSLLHADQDRDDRMMMSISMLFTWSKYCILVFSNISSDFRVVSEIIITIAFSAVIELSMMLGILLHDDDNVIDAIDI